MGTGWHKTCTQAQRNRPDRWVRFGTRDTNVALRVHMKMQKWLVAAGVAAALALSASSTLAQDDGGPGGPGGGRRGGNFDPAQFRQNMLDRVKETLEVTKDDEWQALQPRIEKVMDARMASMGGGMRGMFGPRRNNNGGGGGNGGDNAQRRGPFNSTPMPEAEALQKAIDAKASNAEIKTALTKYTAAMKVKADELKAMQDDLRKLLTPRQEAIATLNGWLN